MKFEQDPITGEDKCALTTVEEIEAARQVINILNSFIKLTEDEVMRNKADYGEIMMATERLPDITQPALISSYAGFLVSAVLKPETPILFRIDDF